MRIRILTTTALAAAALSLSGCVAAAFQTSLPPRAEAHPGFKNNLRYTIAEVRVNKTWPAGKFGGEPHGIIPGNAVQAHPANPAAGPDFWRNAILDAAVRRHPALFTKDYPAVPLLVEIDAKTDNSLGSMIALELCTLCILGGILPLPTGEEADLSVHLRRYGAPASAAPAFEFKREDKMWLSIFTPLALIPYPARSDAPRMSASIFQLLDQEAAKEAGKAPFELTADSLVEGIVRALEKDPKAFGTTPHSRPPVAAPTPTGEPASDSPPPPDDAPLRV